MIFGYSYLILHKYDMLILLILSALAIKLHICFLGFQLRFATPKMVSIIAYTIMFAQEQYFLQLFERYCRVVQM